MYILINSNVLANSTPFLKYKHLHNVIFLATVSLTFVNFLCV